MNSHSKLCKWLLKGLSIMKLQNALLTALCLTTTAFAIEAAEIRRLSLANAFHEEANSNRHQVSDVLDTASHHCGLEIDVYDQPWARMLHSVQYGNVDGVITTPDNSEYSTSQFPKLHSVLDFSRAIFYNAYRLYSLNPVSHADITNLEGLVGIERDNHSLRLADSLGLNTFEGNTPESLVNMLLRERLDYLLVNHAQFENLMARVDSDQRIHASDLTFPAVPFFIAFSNDFYNRNKAIAHCVWDSILLTKTSNQGFGKPGS